MITGAVNVIDGLLTLTLPKQMFEHGAESSLYDVVHSGNIFFFFGEQDDEQSIFFGVRRTAYQDPNPCCTATP